MSEKVQTYFDGKYDKGGELRKTFAWPIRSLKGITKTKFKEFKRDVRIEFNIAKNSTLIDTPVKTGKMLNNYNFILAITDENVSVSVKNKVGYLHYNNSGTPKIDAKEFVTANFDDSEKDLNELTTAYKDKKVEKVLPIVTQVTFTAYSRIQNDIDRINRNLLNFSKPA